MTFASSYKNQLLRTLKKIGVACVDQAVSWLEAAREAGRQIFVCGNGGSAATASHFVRDVPKDTASTNGRRARIIALNESMATVTAYSNDLSYEMAFFEQLENFANRNDVLIALSGSGNSRNVIRAMEYATVHGRSTIALTGRDGGKLGPLAGLHIECGGGAHGTHRGRAHDDLPHDCVCPYGPSNGIASHAAVRSRQRELATVSGAALELVRDDVQLLIPHDDVRDPELSIVIPTLNERITIEEFIRWCKEGLARAGVVGEILIVDSSSDETLQLALAYGARVLKSHRARSRLHRLVVLNPRSVRPHGLHINGGSMSESELRNANATPDSDRAAAARDRLRSPVSNMTFLSATRTAGLAT